MTDRRDIVIARWPGRDGVAETGLSGLLAAYHLQTEEEKGQPVPGVADLPRRYRAEIEDPWAVFADDVVLMALDGDTAVGCLVLTSPLDVRTEVKRLWTTPVSRGRGVASALLGTALDHAAEMDVDTVRLSVWRWRTGAIALYKRFGFTVTTAWDRRDGLVCMERPVERGPNGSGGEAPARGGDTAVPRSRGDTAVP
ncbi:MULTISPECIES: GNAT family N-acetyltransferase [Streptomyces]|uniref:GNAT family N-acetyltransferase n=2 Tax=Streptomyces TaxID=1883 RepID=A0ABV9IK04_9ACTN